MIRLVVREVFKPGVLDQVLALFEELADSSRKDDGCLEYVIGQDVEQPDTLAVLEAWRDKPSLEAHIQSPHFQRLVPQIGALRLESHMDMYTVVV